MPETVENTKLYICYTFHCIYMHDKLLPFHLKPLQHIQVISLTPLAPLNYYKVKKGLVEHKYCAIVVTDLMRDTAGTCLTGG